MKDCEASLVCTVQVETGPCGVVWALGYDGTAWAYTGGWGGAHFKASALVHPVQDRKYFYIYENQRWNPLTGFTAHGLPTDRYHKERIKLFVSTFFHVSEGELLSCNSVVASCQIFL